MPDSSLVSVRLPTDLREAVDALAKGEKRSRSFIVKEAVAAYVEERQAYLQAIDEGVAELDSGRSVPGEAFSRWANSLGTDEELPPPVRKARQA